MPDVERAAGVDGPVKPDHDGGTIRLAAPLQPA